LCPQTPALTCIRKLADLVQQLYLKELSAFKPTPIKPSDSEGHVQKFAIPKAPTSPEEANIANELKTYETQQPDIEGAAAEGTAPVVEDWFEEEEDEPASGGH
jgi:F-type H+-transporting ATPase subunit h